MLVLLVAVSIAVVYNERRVAAEHEHTDAAWSLVARPIQSNDHIVGSTTAPIQLLVYGDLSCPFCKRFDEQTLPYLQRRFGTTTVFAFRHLPLSIHPQAHAEAIASECIYAQKGDVGYWRFVHNVYANPDFEQGLSADQLRNLAMSLGADPSVYDQCLRSPDAAARVDKDALEASVAGLTITPSVILKSAHRAFIVLGGNPVQISSAITYLLDAERQLSQQ